MFAKYKDFKYFNLIFDSIPDMVFMISRDKSGEFYYVTANQSAVDNLKFPADYAGKKITELMPPYSAKVIISMYEKALTTGDAVLYEEKIEFPDGMEGSPKIRTGWVESRLTPVLNEQGECEYIIAITREITNRKNRERELSRVKEQFELIFQNVADAVFTFDEEGNYQHVNPAFSKLFGWSRDELTANPAISILPESERERDKFSEILTRLKNGEVIENDFAERQTKNGSTIRVLASYTPILEDGRMNGGIAVYKNITNVEELREQLRESEDRYRIIVENSNDLIRVTDSQGEIVYASPSHERILGLHPGFFEGKSFLSFVHQEDMHKVSEFFKRILDSGESDEMEYRRLDKHGNVIWVHSKGGPVRNTKGEVEKIVFVSRDVSERKQKEIALEAQALHDELTGLPNRTLFTRYLDEAMSDTDRTGAQTVLMMLDCDNFKSVNDEHGHHAGDEVIREFARRITAVIDADQIAARLGGDEFQVLLPESMKREKAKTISERIITAMEEPFVINEVKLYLTTSIGISFYAANEQKTKEVLVKEADLALYQSKNQGKNRYTIYQGAANKKQAVNSSWLKRLFQKKLGE
ncbi:PAS domain S-box protein [Sediminibacillus halophilus]|uniref:PAS domain S-box-containing protein/diguanylate cyclase (GGDEF) domain-containing protein n=1 Tax=Sediminibacillus halophilus TaxID=482461 RepID=A0A1G9P8X1_9BACI|nr:PAS domain S-box protein [Sediminibacillus halophilus]SDL94605.1 PAS domain S-box-containing protein/diguanylate cyclase (GGDEF) domain-containing protein [Sediminibacillus halophilus]